MLRCRLPYFMAMVDSKKTITIYTLPKILEALSDGNIDCKIYGNSLQGGLPAGYTQLEYIESTGTQYIDTGIILDKLASEVFINFKKTNNANAVSLMGCQDSRGSYNLRQTYYYASNALRFYNSTSSSYSNLGVVDDNVKHTIHTIVDNNNNITLNMDGVTKTFTQQSNMRDNSLKLYLFANNSDGSAVQKVSAQMYSVWIRNASDTLVFNGVPAKRLSDSVIGMYDTVTNTFLTNAGTGTFVAGKEVKPTPTNPIEIESVGDKTKNLANTLVLVEGDLSGSKGTIVIARDKYVSDFIQIKHNTDYYCQNVTTYCLYDENKTYTTGANTIGNPNFSFNSNTSSYIRIAFDKININAVQLELGSQATPYEPYGYKIPVSVKSDIKNLFNKDGEITNWYSSARVITTASANRTLAIRHIPGTEYYYKHCNVAGGGRYFYTNVENPEVGSEASVMYGSTIMQPNQVVHIQDLPDDTKWVFFNAGRTGQTATAQEQLDDYMITTTPIDENTPYKPYGNETTNIYLNEPLRKIGDYADYIDFENQTVVRNVYCQTDITQSASLSAGRYLCNTDKENISQSQQVTIALSNMLQNGSDIEYGQFSYLYNYVGMYKNTLNVPRIVISKIDGASTIEEIQNALKGIEIYYPLATPTTETYTIDTPISVSQGTFTFDVDTVVKPSQVDLTGDIADSSM